MDKNFTLHNKRQYQRHPLRPGVLAQFKGRMARILSMFLFWNPESQSTGAPLIKDVFTSCFPKKLSEYCLACGYSMNSVANYIGDLDRMLLIVQSLTYYNGTSRTLDHPGDGPISDMLQMMKQLHTWFRNAAKLESPLRNSLEVKISQGLWPKDGLGFF